MPVTNVIAPPPAPGGGPGPDGETAPPTIDDEPSPEVVDETTEPSETLNSTTAPAGAPPTVKRATVAGRGSTVYNVARLHTVWLDTGMTAGNNMAEFALDMTDYLVGPSRASLRMTQSILTLDFGVLGESLNSLQDQVAIHTGYHRLTAGTATTVVAFSAAGYTMWTLRAGFLVASFMSSLPAWRAFDPLPILTESREASRHQGRKNEPQDELESMFSSGVEN